MQRTCANAWCSQTFAVTDDDLAFYEKVSPIFHGKKELIPPPRLCPACRSLRRYTYRNERHLYRRPCSLTGRSMMSLYPPDTPFPVYEPSAWHSDAWDPKATGRPFDFSRPFFGQYRELQQVAPRIALAAVNNENCDYVNQVWYSKNWA